MLISIRTLLLALGLCAMGWGAAAAFVPRQDIFLQRVAKSIIAGDPLKTDFLLAILPAVDAVEAREFCHPLGLHGAAIVRLRLFEDALSAGERDQLEAKSSSLRRAIRASLACGPADPYLWLVLFWLETTQDGFKPHHMRYLEMSYRLGPNEGWISLKRAGIALANWQRLPAALADATTSEFAALVANGAHRFAVSLLQGPGWPARDTLVAGLRPLPEHTRERFQNEIYREGLLLKVPGVVQDDKPAWMRR